MHLSPTIRRLIALAVTLVSVMTMVALGAPANAASGSVDATCTGGLMSFAASPGLLLTNQQNSVTGASTAASTCVGGPTGTGSATLKNAAASGLIGCVTQSSVVGSTKVKWADGTTSGLAVTELIPGVAVSAAMTLKATVTVGRFLGDNVTIVLAIPLFNPVQCLTAPGVQSGTGVPTFTFTQP